MSSPSPASDRVALIGCGALSTDIAEICEQRGWAVDHFPLPPLLHNSPKEIAPRVEALILELRATHERIAIAYADCGTYGALDEVCSRYGVERLGGDHCYDLYAGADVIADLSRQEPGTYFLTDFLVLGFDRLVWRELGLDRHPDLRDDYFRHYRRVVWLASRDTPDMRRAAERAAGRIELPLVVRELARSGEEGQAPFAQSLAVLLAGPLPQRTDPHEGTPAGASQITSHVMEADRNRPFQPASGQPETSSQSDQRQCSSGAASGI